MTDSYNSPDQMLTELEAVEQKYLLDLPRYQRNLKLWFIRWGIGASLIIFFWEYTWVRWTLVLAVPVAFVSLGIALVGVFVLPRRLARVRQRMTELNSQLTPEHED